MSLILDGTNGLSDVDGSAATPAIRGSDANTGVFFGADQVGIATNGVERVEFGNSETVFNDGGANVDFRVEGDTDANLLFVDASADKVGIGTTSPVSQLHIYPSTANVFTEGLRVNREGQTGQYAIVNYSSGVARIVAVDSLFNSPSIGLFTSSDGTTQTERARIDSSGNLLVGKTDTSTAVVGTAILPTATAGFIASFTADAQRVVIVNRLTNDGDLVSFRQASTEEGTISVSGSTVSYNGGHLSRWAQTTAPKDDTLVKGTVLSNLDEMNVYVAPTTYWMEEDELPEGVNVGDVKVETHEVQNEQLNKVKVSDVEGDANVAGVFVNWTHDDAHDVDEINMAMTGDMIIRIAEGTTVARGDLLMSAGDGTAKPQGDDIVRSKTIAKVTSTHVTCTYADGSFCVPCVLMAC
jgi:hypothetical protein